MSITDEKMKTETEKVETRNGSQYAYKTITRCKLCKVETKEGHPITVCVFALSQKIARLEAALATAVGRAA